MSIEKPCKNPEPRYKLARMKPFLPLILLAAASLTLAACAGERRVMSEAPLIPLPGAPIDPGDEVVDAAVAEFLKDTGAPAFSSYQIERYDLDGDQRREALVLFSTPYGYWCDMHGCTMLVLKASDNDFTLVNAIQPLREPLYVSNIETQGWKTMVARISGRWNETKEVALQFNGEQYPANPTALPPYTRFADAGGEVRLFHEY